MPKVIPIIYNGNNKYGDFLWMINQKKYDNCLFLFNDNIEKHKTNDIGLGNACIRHFNKYNEDLKIPRSAGIITGSFRDRGFKKLNKKNKKIIDSTFDEIIQLIKKYNYEKIYFSSNKEKNKIGINLFDVNEDVILYITKKLLELKKI